MAPWVPEKTREVVLVIGVMRCGGPNLEAEPVVFGEKWDEVTGKKS